MKFSELVDIRNKLNLIKMGVQKWRILKTGPSKIKVLNLLSWKHEVLKESKYKKKEKIRPKLGGIKMGVFPETARRNSSFLNTDARHMKFSTKAYIKKTQNVTKFGSTKLGASSNVATESLNF